MRNAVKNVLMIAVGILIVWGVMSWWQHKRDDTTADRGAAASQVDTHEQVIKALNDSLTHVSAQFVRAESSLSYVLAHPPSSHVIVRTVVDTVRDTTGAVTAINTTDYVPKAALDARVASYDTLQRACSDYRVSCARNVSLLTRSLHERDSVITYQRVLIDHPKPRRRCSPLSITIGPTAATNLGGKSGASWLGGTIGVGCSL